MGDIGEPLRRIEFDPMHTPAPVEPETAPTPMPVPDREAVPA